MYTMAKKINLLRRHLNNEYWFVLYTRHNFEKIIYKKLKELGFNAYLPLQKELRHWNDRTVWIETPLFRSYIFIKTNLKNKDKAFRVNGILNYVSFGLQLAVLSEEEIERIKKLCSYAGKVTIELESPEVNSKVEICDGVLKGLKGYLTDVNNSRKIHINIKSLNCFASAMIDSDTVSLKYI
jgi:transcription antitermination factor NusG